jgi:hypothetical protein
VYNIDRTRNAAGSITHCAEIIIQCQEHRERITAEVTDLGMNQMSLGYMWLSHHNPEIDWTIRNSPNDLLPMDLPNLDRETLFAQHIESEEQDSLAHIFALKQDEPAPKIDPKPQQI